MPELKGVSKELRVGVFVLFCMSIIAAFSFKITDTPIFRRGTVLVTYLDDATGVFQNSKVKLAGIDIGVIQKIELDGGKAKIYMRINRGVDIPRGSRIVPRPLGILGDKYLEVVLPKPAEPSKDPSGGQIETDESAWIRIFDVWIMPKAHAQTPSKSLKEGEVIRSDSSPATLDDLTRQMGTVSEDIRAVSSSLRRLIEGEPDPKTPLGRTVRNVEKISQDLGAIVVENRSALKSSVQRLNKVTQKLEKAMDGVDEAKLSRDLENLSKAAGNLGQSLDDLKKITAKVERGEGTLGVLVNDDGIARDLQRALSSINSSIERAQRTLVLVDVNTLGSLNEGGGFQSEIGLRLMPRESSGYWAALVSTPRGRRKTTIQTVRVNGGAPTVTETIEEDSSSFEWNLQYYRRVGPVAARLGLFESTGGLALDAYALHDQIQASMELFDFAREQDHPRLRTTLRFFPLSEVYFLVGLDDVLAASPSRQWQLGLGLRFTDDDLKTLLMLPGVP
jgi:phospholipid/cholesterol/gamma-HCH transport system substrate-binding protein